MNTALIFFTVIFLGFGLLSAISNFVILAELNRLRDENAELKAKLERARNREYRGANND